MTRWSPEAFQRREVPLWLSRYGAPRPADRSGRRAHPYAVIILVTRGESTVRHTGELVLRAGDVHLIPPGDGHGPTQFSRVEGWCLAFHPELFPRATAPTASEDAAWGTATGVHLGPLARVRTGCHPVLHPDRAQRRRLERWFTLLEEELASPARAQDDAARALLRLILIELERIAAPTAAPESAGLGLARRALSHIEANALQPLSLAALARELGRSPTHVAGVIRRETGRTAGEWILEYRMAEARRRLRGTDERIDVLAERVGYADATHFIRLFRRMHGLTPAAWRRRATAAPS